MRYWVAIVATFLYSSLCSQSFNVQVDRTEIALDQYVQVDFVLENAQGKNFAPPGFEGWTIIQGPSTSSSVSIINGARSSTFSYGYVLSPKSTGNLSIGKASITVNNKTLSTQPVSIKVTKSSPQANLQGKNAKTLSKKDIFITAKATPATAYVGQQIVVEYKLYTAVDVENYNILHTPEFKGFHVNTIPRLSYDNRETINGRNYITKVIYAASIYPIQNGKFQVEALHSRASIVVDDGRNNPNSFFLLPTTEGVNLISDKLDIEVLSLPQPSPSNFSGAVGTYALSTQIDQLHVKLNDAITVTVYIEGDGDLNRVNKPFLNLDSFAFQQYDPKITKENIDYKLDGFVGMRELTFPVVAVKPGVHKIVPSFVYFNTDSQKYTTLAPEVFNLTVTTNTAGNTKAENSADKKEDSEELKLIQYPKLPTNKFVGTTFYYLCLLLPLLIWFSIFIWQRKKSAYEKANAGKVLLKKGQKENIERLSILYQSPVLTKKEADEAYEIMIRHLMQYFKITDRSISKSDWLNQIQTADFSDEIRSRIANVLDIAEMSIYAGQMIPDQVKKMIEDVKIVVEKVE